MADLWTRGGLSWRELIKRTARESWEDEVFGQAARLAFYHFLALFPALLLAAMILARFSGAGSNMLQTLQSSLATVLPPPVSEMVTSFFGGIGGRVARHSLWFATFGSLWAAVNGTWAVMSGLNAAYEVEERRSVWRVTLTAAGLTLALAGLGLSSLILLFYSRSVGAAIVKWAGLPGSVPILWQIVHWPILAAMLLIAFALLYRFGPNVSDREMRWGTPGAVVAMILWLCASGLFRGYIAYEGSNYDEVYGAAGALAILLLWLYFTGAAILIGGEVNSEIENAAAQHGHPDAGRPGQHRQGGVSV
ncbi:MAG: YihY/virulence factor BrkB family protein [Bryobacteraceae bacterium]|jgi:membrane protein